ncbi:MAG: hypothetical protein ACI304_03990 [Lepagella sp.]
MKREKKQNGTSRQTRMMNHYGLIAIYVMGITIIMLQLRSLLP